MFTFRCSVAQVSFSYQILTVLLPSLNQNLFSAKPISYILMAQSLFNSNYLLTAFASFDTEHLVLLETLLCWYHTTTSLDSLPIIHIWNTYLSITYRWYYTRVHSLWPEFYISSPNFTWAFRMWTFSLGYIVVSLTQSMLIWQIHPLPYQSPFTFVSLFPQS